MKLRRIFILIFGLLLMISFIQAQNVQITINASDDKGGSGVVKFGNGMGYTYCIDADTSVFHPAEVGLPPAPPSGIFDVRFVDSRLGAGACLDQGIGMDLLGWSTTDDLLDTFKIQWQLTSGATVMRFSWPANLSAHFLDLSMKDAFGGVLVNWNMLTKSADSVTNPAILTLTITGTKKRYDPLGVSRLGKGVPTEFALNQNYPNPFNPSTTIKFAVEKSSNATVAVYDALGRKVATLVADQLTPGFYNTTWNGTDDRGHTVSSGVYYVRMNATYSTRGAEQTFSAVRKLLLMK